MDEGSEHVTALIEQFYPAADAWILMQAALPAELQTGYLIFFSLPVEVGNEFSFISPLQIRTICCANMSLCWAENGGEWRR